MDALFIIKLLLLPFAFIAPGFFAGSETALISLSGMNLAQLKVRHPLRKTAYEFWEKYPDRVLAFIVLGNTLGTVFAGVLAASIGKDCAEISGLPGKWIILIISAAVTLMVLIFGEVLPKILGRLYSEKIAGFTIMILVPSTKLAHPVVKTLVYIAKPFLHILGTEPQKEIPNLNALELYEMMGTESGTDPVLPSRRLLRNILEFGRLEVNEVKKPREKIAAVDINEPAHNVILKISNLPYSRVPVYKGSLDNIVGIIYAKDLLTAWRTAGLILIPDLVRPAYFTSQNTLISELLREFKKGHHHFAIVKDPSGKVTGMITIEDVLEEIIGEIYDEAKIQ